MPSPKQVHSFSASSATAWIEADTSRIAQVNFVLAATCDYVSVEIPSHVLERPVGSAQRPLHDAHLRPHGRLTASRSATLMQKHSAMTANLQNPIFTDETKAREWLEVRVWPH
jgi:hypothetical protein